MKSIDLTGRKYNHLTVLGIGEGGSAKKKYWRCLCDCGNITNVETSKLVSLHTKSCGCAKKLVSLEDITGKVFGYFTVLSFAYSIGGKAYWKCRCICGKESIESAKLLKSRHKTSCGCKKGEIRVKNLIGQRFGKLLVVGRAEAQKKGIYWECKCDCGNTAVVSSRCLLTHSTKSCGCLTKISYNRKNLQGKRFGKLTALKYVRTEGKKAIWLCKCDCGNTLETKSAYLLNNDIHSCGCLQSSFREKEVLEYIRAIYKGEIRENDRDLIAPKEVDIYIPDKKFAVEFDGLYWHSEAVKTDRNYHKNKTDACLKKGVRLFHIYEDEWRDKKDIVKSMVASALGVYKKKIYARDCVVKEITNKGTVSTFFAANHIQGAVHTYSLALGLYKGRELLQACVFGKQHFDRNKDIELYRMVTKLNTQVVGGFSKIMEHTPYNTVVSYVALRMFDAKGYLAGKWKIESESAPSFCLTDGHNTFSRHLFKKERCLSKFDNVTEDMTEREMQIKNGLYRIWDSGTYKVRWTR